MTIIKKGIIENVIVIDGRDDLLDSLTKEETEQLRLLLMDAFMSTLGYQRKKSTK